MKDRLIKAFGEGDERAFTQLYNQLKGKAFLAAYKATRSRVEAEDISMIVFERLWEKRDAFDTMAHVSRWVYQVAFRLGLDKRKTSPPTYEFNEEIHDAPEEHVDLSEQDIIRLELVEKVYQITKSLAPYKQRIFQLYFIDGKKIKDICEALELNKQTVYNTIYRIKNAFT